MPLGIRVCVFPITTAIAVVDEADSLYFTYADLPLMRNPLVQAARVRLAAEMPPGGPVYGFGQDNRLHGQQLP